MPTGLKRGALVTVVTSACCAAAVISAFPQGIDPPATTVKLIFIHHSSGENWLKDIGDGDQAGGLGEELRDNNYFVSDTNYGWAAPNNPDIGNTTDIGHWYTWFADTTLQSGVARRDRITGALFIEYGQHSTYSRLGSDPSGENKIVMFKSCFPNSGLRGNPSDPPNGGANPLRGQDCYREEHSVANAKGIYNNILAYFAARQDKLFVVITAPPLMDGTYAAAARGFNDWLVGDWLAGYDGGAGYPYSNVAVFDYYRVLTSNGGVARTSFSDYAVNDLGRADGNHHRWTNGSAEHLRTVANNRAAYPSWASDDHPYSAGNVKATGEFVPLLNFFYNRWKGNLELPARVNFQTTAVTMPAGFFKDDASDFGIRGIYGWR